MAMAIGTVLTVAQTLFTALQCSELREICSMFGYKSHLEELERTASTIRSVLLDADSKQEGFSNEARDWIDKLKDAVYDVDDLLDAFNTIIQCNKLQKQLNESMMINKISKKVRHFFSHSNKLIVAFNMSLDVKKIRKKLAAIASDHSKFGFSVDYEPIRMTRKATWSYVNNDRIIGREGDKEALVDLLLQDQPTVQDNVVFVTIVGIGGLGKTALAQLIYGDDKIKNEFELRLWVCVSEEFGVKEILSKILMSATDQNCDDLGVDQLQRKVRQQIQGKRYFLVLDDIWCESHKEWVDLKDFLICGGKGSRILVTTRSKLVARAIGNHLIYDLKGLSPQDSWLLFVQMAFDNHGEQAESKLVEIGQEIVKKCTNVPLSIRVTGSMLYGQDRRKWHLFREVNLSKIRHGEDDTMAILKFSYNHLPPSLKSCFSYCALFPKDYAIQKDLLINLWLAHGCIEPQYEGQSIEDVSEEYFSTLLGRCFFQEIRTDYFGDIYECKMHDLIHDLAQEVAGNESSLWSGSGSHFKGKLRHLSILEGYPGLFYDSECAAQLRRMRTFLPLCPYWLLHPSVSQSHVQMIASNGRYLRVLDLHGCSVRILPSTIGELVHLRYLDLSHNSYLEMLPKSITNLHNLQVMGLRWCRSLKALPEDLSKLVNLRVLDIDDCDTLTHMPARMYKLTCLHILSMFVVGGTNCKQIKVSQLNDLEALEKLGGELTIKFGKYFEENASEVVEGRYLLTKSRLKSLVITFRYGCLKDDVEEAVLEGLMPNHDLRKIKIYSYKGEKLPRWASMENSLRTSLPCLVLITLKYLPRLKYLPSMRQLAYLKRLELDSIENLEYMEKSNISISSTTSSTPRDDVELTFFPSLEDLRLRNMHKLKGWWRADNTRVDEDNAIIGRRDKKWAATRATTNTNANDVMQLASSSLLLFPRLRMLEIKECCNLTSFPSCPQVEELCLYKVNEEFSFSEKICSNIIPITSCMKRFVEPKRLLTDKFGGYKNCLTEESTQSIVSLEILCYKEESLYKVGAIKLFQSCAFSLQRLEINYCPSLKSVGRGIFEHLTNLQSLTISDCGDFTFEDDGDDDGLSWKSLESLSYLKLEYLPKLINLPMGFQYLITLLSFKINDCENLEMLPEAMRHLPSLTQLCISGCFKLTERCRGPDGDDWHKICHIPSLIVRN